MTRFTLTLVGEDGRAILTTTERLDAREVDELRARWAEWLTSGGLAIIADCVVRRVESIALDLDERGLSVERRRAERRVKSDPDVPQWEERRVRERRTTDARP